MVSELLIPTVEAVKCCMCGNLMEASSNCYVTFPGGISEGGSLKRLLLPDRCVCRTDHCIGKLYKLLLGRD